MTHIRKPGLRGQTTGWSKTAVRNNIKFLRSVDERHLIGQGLAITLTVRGLPSTPDDWAATRHRFFSRLERIGYIRLHWVTEWQERGVPHLHLAAYFPPSGDTICQQTYYNANTKTLEPQLPRDIKTAWLESASHLEPVWKAQDIRPITAAIGWFQYCAKHLSRGADHYQRSQAAIPDSWEKTGRVWGKRGNWPTQAPMDLSFGSNTFYRYRRAMRNWRIAQKSLEGAWKQKSAARRMLKCNDPEESRYRGTSEWMPQDSTLQLLHFFDQGIEHA